MFLLRDINPLLLKLLNLIYRKSRHHQVRQRAHFLILVLQNVKNENLIKIFKFSYKTRPLAKKICVILKDLLKFRSNFELLG